MSQGYFLATLDVSLASLQTLRDSSIFRPLRTSRQPFPAGAPPYIHSGRGPELGGGNFPVFNQRGNLWRIFAPCLGLLCCLPGVLRRCRRRCRRRSPVAIFDLVFGLRHQHTTTNTATTTPPPSSPPGCVCDPSSPPTPPPHLLCVSAQPHGTPTSSSLCWPCPACLLCCPGRPHRQRLTLAILATVTCCPPSPLVLR